MHVEIACELIREVNCLDLHVHILNIYFIPSCYNAQGVYHNTRESLMGRDHIVWVSEVGKKFLEERSFLERAVKK